MSSGCSAPQLDLQTFPSQGQNSRTLSSGKIKNAKCSAVLPGSSLFTFVKWCCSHIAGMFLHDYGLIFCHYFSSLRLLSQSSQS